MKFYVFNSKIKRLESLKTIDIPPKSVYEVIKLIEGKPLFFEDHLERFFNSISSMDYYSNLTAQGILSDIEMFTKVNQLTNANIRLVYMPSLKEESFDIIISLSESINIPNDKRESGVSVETIEIERENPNTKTVGASYKDRLKSAKNKDALELLLVDYRGYITEGSKTNIFFVEGNKLITPPREKVLLGVTRKYILNICQEDDIEVSYKNIKYKNVNLMDGAFLSGTTVGILPVKQINEVIFNNNQLINHIIKRYDSVIKSYIKDFEIKKE